MHRFALHRVRDTGVYGDVAFRVCSMTEKLDIALTVNGRAHAIRVEPRKTLVDAIREDCGLTGTHIGCEHGVCGACTVILDGEAVRACLMFAVQAKGKSIRTVELLAEGAKLHPCSAPSWRTMHCSVASARRAS